MQVKTCLVWPTWDLTTFYLRALVVRTLILISSRLKTWKILQLPSACLGRWRDTIWGSGKIKPNYTKLLNKNNKDDFKQARKKMRQKCFTSAIVNLCSSVFKCSKSPRVLVELGKSLFACAQPVNQLLWYEKMTDPEN